MGLTIYRSRGIDRVADHAYALAECLEKYGAYFDSEPVLRVPKKAIMDAMKDKDFGADIANAFKADLKDDEEEVTYYLDY